MKTENFIEILSKLGKLDKIKDEIEWEEKYWGVLDQNKTPISNRLSYIQEHAHKGIVAAGRGDDQTSLEQMRIITAIGLIALGEYEFPERENIPE